MPRDPILGGERHDAVSVNSIVGEAPRTGLPFIPVGSAFVEDEADRQPTTSK